MDGLPDPLYGSQFVRFLAIVMVSVPPYCGTPSLSHQCPVLAVVVAVVVVTGAVVVVFVVVVVAIEVEVAVEVVVVVLAQDARASDVTMRQVSSIQIDPFFITLLFFRDFLLLNRLDQPRSYESSISYDSLYLLVKPITCLR